MDNNLMPASWDDFGAPVLPTAFAPAPSSSVRLLLARGGTHQGDTYAAETMYFVGVLYVFEKLSLPSAVIRNRLASQFPIDGRRLVRSRFLGIFQC